MREIRSDVSFIALLLIMLVFQGCAVMERMGSIDKKLDVLIEQGKTVKERK